MQKSNIKNIIPQPDKEWNGKVLRKRSIALEDGTAGTVTLFPNDPEIEEGQEIEYTAEDKGYGVEIKLKKEGGGGGFKAKQWSPAQVAHENACKLTAAALQGQQLNVEDYKIFFGQCKEFMIENIKQHEES